MYFIATLIHKHCYSHTVYSNMTRIAIIMSIILSITSAEYQEQHKVPEKWKIFYPVEVIKHVEVPVEKVEPYYVEKMVPYIVEKPYIVKIDKHYKVPIPKPYVVHVPYRKYIYHHKNKGHGGMDAVN